MRSCSHRDRFTRSLPERRKSIKSSFPPLSPQNQRFLHRKTLCCTKLRAELETVSFSLRECSIGRLRFDASALLKATAGHFAAGALAALALASGFRPH